MRLVLFDLNLSQMLLIRQICAKPILPEISFPIPFSIAVEF